ncbi:thiamine phosphate synthase [Chitinophaga pendula]|uniref:thiamine phosphate synthase n=1 Tax=Chitinophaga TaxID=79328 RepID=UPI000BB0C857|nr:MULTISPECIES: thiamine phosphate synthase [Chitinophaga]ASZ10254.1 thiamine phosphate synthase [Chitinophaga sp. MD30]UCJ06786.1 thiamine phosphate synthase [Chitinophaga pendula]
MIDSLHYISQATATHTHLENIREACVAGCRWIQLRIKDAPEDIILAQAIAAKAICQQYGAVLIINDHPQVALAAGADGVHVGKEDMTVAEARAIVGDYLIVGGTANTLDDILQHVTHGADYVGVGPYRFTTTKQKLSPILGLEGYMHLMEALRARHINIPVIAIGGILQEDIPALLDTGVHGVAVSGLITHAADKASLLSMLQGTLARY